MRLAGVTCALAVAVLGAIGATARATSETTPQALYFRLLKTPITASDLPPGYLTADIGIGSLTKRAQKFHAVGEVDVTIDGGHAFIDFIVFPSRAAAIADWKDSKDDFHKNTDTQQPAPPDLPWPAIIGNSSITGKSATGKAVTNGVTTLSFTPKNVIVQTFTLATDHTGSGDIPGTIKLARYALRHLHAVRR